MKKNLKVKEKVIQRLVGETQRGVGNLEWGGTGEYLGRGRSVHEQPGAKVDGIAPHKERDPSK